MMTTYYSDVAVSKCLKQKDRIDCHWPTLRREVLSQWKKLTPEDLDETGPKRHLIALLIQQKHGVDWQLVENYLVSIERTLPLFG